MDQGISIEDADIAGAKAPCVGDEAVHHHAVDSQQFLHRVGVKAGNEVVGCARVLYFEDVTPVAEHWFSVDNRTHRMFIELVPFDNKRGVDRLDPHLPTQCRAGRQGCLRRQHTDELSDLHAQRINHVGAFERRFVCHDHLLLPP